MKTKLYICQADRCEEGGVSHVTSKMNRDLFDHSLVVINLQRVLETH